MSKVRPLGVFRRRYSRVIRGEWPPITKYSPVWDVVCRICVYKWRGDSALSQELAIKRGMAHLDEHTASGRHWPSWS